MVTVDEIKRMSNIHDIPGEITVNKGIVLDPFLDDNLSDTPKTVAYDFEVHLKDYGVDLQRPFVWNDIQQREFILSLLLNKPVPSFVVVDLDIERTDWDAPTKRLVIDGKQRLLTIKRFLADEFTVTIGGRECRYSDFDNESRGLFARQTTHLTATVYYATEDRSRPWYMSDDMKIILFNFYNFAGTPQEKSHKDLLQGFLRKNA